MTHNLCRLCFVEKTRPKPIEIFGVEGIDLDVAAVIRLHFSDTVIESDNLPKSICRGCWTLVRNFHNLYNTVNEAQNDFLTKFVKNEEPKFMQIDCDPVVCLEDISLIKFETPPDDVVAKIENSSHENSGFDYGNAASESDTDGSDGSPIDHTDVRNLSGDESETYSGSDSKIGGHSSDESETSSEDDGSEYDPNEGKVDRTRKVAKIQKSNAESNEPNRYEKYDHLISEYMDMHCEICEQPFGTLSEAIKHYWKQHQRESATFKCCRLKMKFKEIRDHIEYHLKPDKFKCRECGKCFGSRRRLNNHLASHLQRRYECDICKRIFHSMSGIRSHLTIKHQNQVKHKCELCEKCFLTKSSLSHHVKHIHERRFEQVCHICAKVCSSKGGLNQHMMVHKDVSEPRDTCEFCGKSFKSKLITRIHIKNTHMQDGTLYECRRCLKRFDKKTALAQHVAYYHNFKLHKCDICAKEFKKATALEVHMTTHTGIKLHRCWYCPQNFRSNKQKMIHCEQMHQNGENNE